jgi:hypothetical protein
MQVTVNRQLFSERTFDSGALGVLCSVIHQFAESGVYQAVIKVAGKTERTVWFEVTESASEMQLDIDLAPPPVLAKL